MRRRGLLTARRSGRGNVFLESVLPLARSLHRDIVALGKRIENAAVAEEGSRVSGTKARTAEAHYAELLQIVRDIKDLLARIDQAIPHIQLAITSSGESLSSSMPPGVSPSRFLQASFLLNLGDTQFACDPTRPVQIGPPFVLSLYMLFVGHTTQPTRQDSTEPTAPATPALSYAGTPKGDEPYGFEDGERRPIWQEVLHKARVRLCRTPMGWTFDPNQGYVPSLSGLIITDGNSNTSPRMAVGRPDEYSYHLEIIEDLDDGRVHEEDESKSRPYDDIPHAGIRESVPMHQISKIFYTDTGRILNIGNSDEGGNNPILLLKRDTGAPTAAELADQMLDRGAINTRTPGSSSIASDDQDEIDRQLRDETVSPGSDAEADQNPLRLHLPHHLDPEWMALEVYADDDEDEWSDAEEDAEDYDSDEHNKSITNLKAKTIQRPSLDSKLLEQIKNISIGDSPNSRHVPGSPSRQLQQGRMNNQESFVARSPFGAINSSLSLMEMLIRLTSLQGYQQAAHLSMPDHYLTFFLEETSTTGLKGEDRWKARHEAKRRVGFDPYTDTPTK